jgi:glyoxylase-like metal-dependent hydrolase (beta-lactamase superfamily II)
MHEPVRIGRVAVSVVCEGYAPLELADEMPGAEVDWDAERARHPWAFADDDSWPWHVHAFGLRTPRGLVLVDAGVSPFPPVRPWAEHTPLEEALANAGVDPAEVRMVVHTHLHADHAGGSVVGLPALAYTVYLLYSGVPVMMGVTKERGFLFASAVLAVGLVMLVAVLAATAILWGMGVGPALTTT